MRERDPVLGVEEMGGRRWVRVHTIRLPTEYQGQQARGEVEEGGRGFLPMMVVEMGDRVW